MGHFMASQRIVRTFATAFALTLFGTASASPGVSPCPSAGSADPQLIPGHPQHSELAQPATSSGSEPRRGQLNFKAFAEEYLKTHELEREGLDFRAMVNTEDYVRFDVGSFAIRFPVEVMTDKPLADRIQESLHAIVNVQRHWYAWNGSAADTAEEDWKLVSKWVESLSARKMVNLHGGGESLIEQLGAPTKVRDAVQRLNDQNPYTGEVAETLGERNLTILAPTRKHFLLLSAAAGLARPDLKDQLWKDDLVRYGASWVDYDQIIALENFGHPVQWDKPFLSRPLDQDHKDGLKQYVADRASTVLLRKEYHKHGTHFFEEALAVNLIISYLGTNSSGTPEFDYSYRREGGRTEPYSRFVPGGNPAGGTLPPRKAQAGPTTQTGNRPQEGIYRANQGEDYFLPPLKEGQKLGAKLASKQRDLPNRTDKLVHFQLCSLETGEKTVVSAPFLGLLAEKKVLPKHQFLDDYEDFFRAYRAGFFHWLRTRAEGSDSAERFAELIRAQAERKLGASLDEVILGIYGVPLSAADSDTDSLETRFLGFIKKGR